MSSMGNCKISLRKCIFGSNTLKPGVFGKGVKTAKCVLLSHIFFEATEPTAIPQNKQLSPMVESNKIN